MELIGKKKSIRHTAMFEQKHMFTVTDNSLK